MLAVMTGVMYQSIDTSLGLFLRHVPANYLPVLNNGHQYHVGEARPRGIKRNSVNPQAVREAEAQLGFTRSRHFFSRFDPTVVQTVIPRATHPA